MSEIGEIAMVVGIVLIACAGQYAAGIAVLLAGAALVAVDRLTRNGRGGGVA